MKLLSLHCEKLLVCVKAVKDAGRKTSLPQYVTPFYWAVLAQLSSRHFNCCGLVMHGLFISLLFSMLSKVVPLRCYFSFPGTHNISHSYLEIAQDNQSQSRGPRTALAVNTYKSTLHETSPCSIYHELHSHQVLWTDRTLNDVLTLHLQHTLLFI